MRVALLQITGSDDPDQNRDMLTRHVSEAAQSGAKFVLTPEVSNCISASRTHQQAVLRPEAEDATVADMRAAAARHGIWLLLGSVAVKTDDKDDRFANRSLLIGPSGDVAARYDKIHMFDVDISETESYRESAGYRPGDRAIVATTPLFTVGMTICYDLRFPYLYRHLAQAGANVLTVPSAFSPVTGAAHWEPLLRARAIETGCFVLAPAQCGTHAASRGRSRETHGHSLIVDPWGAILADGGGDAPGLIQADIDLDAVARARRKVPSLDSDRDYERIAVTA